MQLPVLNSLPGKPKPKLLKQITAHYLCLEILDDSTKNDALTESPDSTSHQIHNIEDNSAQLPIWNSLTNFCLKPILIKLSPS